MQRKNLILIILMMVLTLSVIHAQELPPFEGEFEVITLENASRLQEVAVLGALEAGRRPWWSADGETVYVQSTSDTVWAFSVDNPQHPAYLNLADVPPQPEVSYQPRETDLETPVTTSPDGRYEVFYELVSVDDFLGLLHVIDTTSGEEIRTIPCHLIGLRSYSGDPFVPQFSSFGLYYISRSNPQVSLGDLRRWNPESDAEEIIFANTSDDYFLSPDGTLMMVATGRPGRYSMYRIYELWDLRTTPPILLYEPQFATKGDWNSVAISPDGQTVATGGQNASIRQWNMSSYGNNYVENRPPVGFGDDPVIDLAYSPDGLYVAGAVNTISVGHALILDASTAEELVRISGTSTGNGYTFYSSVGFHPDGGLIFFGGTDGTLRGWRMETLLQSGGTDVEEATYILSVHDEAVADIVFNPQGTRFVTASWDDTVRLWDFPSLQLIATFTGHTEDVWSAVISPIYADLIATASDDYTVRLWDAATGQASILPMERVEATIRDLRFSADGSVLFGVESGGDIYVWDVNRRQLVSVSQAEFPSYVWHFDLSMDGKFLVTAGDNGLVRLVGIPAD